MIIVVQARIPTRLLDRLRPITVAEYHQMIQVGALHEDEHIELIEGVIVEMPPHGPPHATAVERLTRLFVRAVGDDWIVRPQLPITLDTSEPEPDLALVAAKDTPHGAHPRTASLVIEVADSSVDSDREVKAPLYARAGIIEYWIVDVRANAILVHRDPEPSEDRYATLFTIGREGSVSPLALPTLVVRVADVLR